MVKVARVVIASHGFKYFHTISACNKWFFNIFDTASMVAEYNCWHISEEAVVPIPVSCNKLLPLVDNGIEPLVKEFLLWHLHNAARGIA